MNHHKIIKFLSLFRIASLLYGFNSNLSCFKWIIHFDRETRERENSISLGITFSRGEMQNIVFSELEMSLFPFRPIVCPLRSVSELFSEAFMLDIFESYLFYHMKPQMWMLSNFCNLLRARSGRPSVALPCVASDESVPANLMWKIQIAGITWTFIHLNCSHSIVW